MDDNNPEPSCIGKMGWIFNWVRNLFRPNPQKIKVQDDLTQNLVKPSNQKEELNQEIQKLNDILSKQRGGMPQFKPPKNNDESVHLEFE